MNPLSIAPMMDRTDRHFRGFVRVFAPRALLYTEMITSKAITRGDRAKLLAYHPSEHPISLQLGGDDPAELAAAARIAVDAGYDEVNLNVGCPSDRVQAGRFGACLMAHPQVVADCVAAIRAVVPVEVTVKHRIGIDDLDTYDHMLAFVDTVASAGCRRFTVHARKAWLSGLSPKENRTIPPLRYDDVWRLKRERPHLGVELNGGVTTAAAVAEHLAQVDAVMVGRAAYDDPYVLVAMEAAAFGAQHDAPSRVDVAAWVADETRRLLTDEGSAWPLLRHLHGLFHAQSGAKAWKQAITTAGRGGDAAAIDRFVADTRARATRAA